MEKPIEEMAKAIYNLDHCEGYKDDRGCMYAPSCSVCKYGRENKAKQISELLTKQGYRKASDVAREIERYLRLNEDIAIRCKAENGEQNEEYWKGKLSAFRQIRGFIDAELKKKYKEGK